MGEHGLISDVGSHAVQYCMPVAKGVCLFRIGARPALTMDVGLIIDIDMSFPMEFFVSIRCLFLGGINIIR